AEEIERALAGAPANARVVVDLDDATIVRNPRSWASLDATAPAIQVGGPAEFSMPVVVEAGATYALAGPSSIASGQTLTVLGRLDCGTTTIGGAGGLAAFPPGLLATAGAPGAGGTRMTT